jgi:hypothetical protein
MDDKQIDAAFTLALLLAAFVGFIFYAIKGKTDKDSI